MDPFISFTSLQVIVVVVIIYIIGVRKQYCVISSCLILQKMKRTYCYNYALFIAASPMSIYFSTSVVKSSRLFYIIFIMCLRLLLFIG